MLKIENLRPENNPAASGLTFYVDIGEIVGLFGPNSSGKTQTTLALSGLRPYKGSVLFQGREVRDWNVLELRRHVGVVFEDTDPFFITQRVHDEVAFGPENLGLDRSTVTEKVEHALRMVGLENRQDSIISVLSGGQKRRLAIASALAPDPTLLLMDNPFVHLDPPTAGELQSYLTGLTRDSKSLWITGPSLRWLGPVKRYLQIDHPGESIHQTLRSFSKEPREISVQAKDLAFRYGQGHKAVDGFTGSFQSGEVTVLLGRNGVGKTTLCKLFTGLLKPRSGWVGINMGGTGYSSAVFISENPETYLYGPTVADDVLLSLKRSGVGVESPSECLTSLGIGSIANEPIANLGRGARRFISIATAALLDPKVMVLDEPNAGLDDQNLGFLARYLKSLAKRSAVLCVTHDLEFAKAAGTRCWIMCDGRLERECEPDNVQTKDI